MVFIYRIGPFGDVGGHVARVFPHEVGKLVGGVAGRGRALARSFIEQLQDELAERFWNIVREDFWLELHLEDVFARFFEVLASEKVLADEHFAGDDAYAKEVACVVDLFAHDLFGTHVGGRADDATCLRKFLADFEWRIRMGDAKIQEANTTVFVNHHVCGLQVAVGDTVSMGMAECAQEFV